MRKNILKSILVMLVMMAATFAFNSQANAAAINVAQGKAVTLNGSFGSTSAAATTLVDNVFRPRGTQWQSNTVWWQGLNQNVVIDLQGTFNIESMVVQADDNDAYKVEYNDLNTNTWATAWNVPNYDAQGWGMQTRPNPANDLARYTLPSVISTDALRFTAVSGDNAYSVSEIQAFGEPVPEPSTAILGLLGLGGLLRARRKK